LDASNLLPCHLHHDIYVAQSLRGNYIVTFHISYENISPCVMSLITKTQRLCTLIDNLCKKKSIISR
jgi:hypothetical protein